MWSPILGGASPLPYDLRGIVHQPPVTAAGTAFLTAAADQQHRGAAAFIDPDTADEAQAADLHIAVKRDMT